MLSSAALAERQRIARDLHDGLATRLLALLASIPPQGPDGPFTDIAHGLQECLMELHMTVDGLHRERTSIGEMLADLRYRFEPAFNRAGIKLLWDVEEIAMPDHDDGRSQRELGKIVQEALTNALRHSGARCVRVRLTGGDGGASLTLEVSDDGRGMHTSHVNASSPVPRRHGQGLSNMRRRATAIQAGISITNARPCGLRVCVSLPLSLPSPLPHDAVVEREVR
jgi:signal transduction histidine kinase